MNYPTRWPLIPTLLYLLLQPLFAQTPDTSRNNLIHAPGQATTAWGALQFDASGPKRKRSAIIFLPGWGFEANSFRDYFEKNLPKHRVYLGTLPGFGSTNPYPMPPAGTSYAENRWMRSAETAVLRLIEKEGLKRPTLVAHFEVASHIALRLAAEHPDKIGKLILIGAPARHVFLPPRDTVSLASRVKAVDFYLAPKWFKTLRETTWRAGNFIPATYSLDSLRGARRFDEANGAPLPVQIGWLCELWAADFSVYERVKNPVLSLLPSFTPELLADPKNAYLRWFTEDWTSLAARNPHIKIQTLENSGCNLMDDQPEALRRALLHFLRE